MCSESGCTPRWETGSALDGINSATSDDESQSKGEVQYEDEDRPEQRLQRYDGYCDYYVVELQVMQQVNITL